MLDLCIVSASVFYPLPLHLEALASPPEKDGVLPLPYDARDGCRPLAEERGEARRPVHRPHACHEAPEGGPPLPALPRECRQFRHLGVLVAVAAGSRWRRRNMGGGTGWWSWCYL
mmetsp:Transcript_68242/g.215875  ORF Transcript_68242/g.215875 Transcript_68242/m.215875 type:complete len:115 (+) Transcript_68242:14-358(+)